MQAADVLVEILRAEGVRQCFYYPYNALIDPMARAGMRAICTRQERVAGNMADGVSRSTNGREIGVVAVQALAGSENAFAGIAHAHTDSSPILFLPGHPGIGLIGTPRHLRFDAQLRRRHQDGREGAVGPRYADQAAAGVHGVALGPTAAGDARASVRCVQSRVQGHAQLYPGRAHAFGRRFGAVREAAERLIAAEEPLIWAGHGVLYAEASAELLAVAEVLGAPVMTTLQGKSAFPESHPLSAGVGAYSSTAMAAHYVAASDVVLACGSSLSVASFTPAIPRGKTILHNTVDSADVNKEYPTDVAIIADSKLFLAQLAEELDRLLDGPRAEHRARTEATIARLRSDWLAEYEAEFADDSAPINGYRMFRELWNVLEPDETILTHESGASRDIQCVFYQAGGPRSYLGWGQSSQLGFSLGLAMGAKVANPEKLVVNVMGDGAVGMTGMDWETASRNDIPILSVIKHDSIFSGYDKHIPVAVERYKASTMTGDYAAVAAALGCHAEMVTEPAALKPAYERAIQATRAGQPAVVDVITAETRKLSRLTPTGAPEDAE